MPRPWVYGGELQPHSLPSKSVASFFDVSVREWVVVWFQMNPLICYGASKPIGQTRYSENLPGGGRDS